MIVSVFIAEKKKQNRILKSKGYVKKLLAEHGLYVQQIEENPLTNPCSHNQIRYKK